MTVRLEDRQDKALDPRWMLVTAGPVRVPVVIVAMRMVVLSVVVLSVVVSVAKLGCAHADASSG